MRVICKNVSNCSGFYGKSGKCSGILLNLIAISEESDVVWNCAQAVHIVAIEFARCSRYRELHKRNVVEGLIYLAGRVWNPNAICAQLASSAFEEFTLAEKNRRDTARLGAFINFPSDDASLGEPGRNFSGSFQRTNTPSGLSRALSIDQRVR